MRKPKRSRAVRSSTELWRSHLSIGSVIVPSFSSFSPVLSRNSFICAALFELLSTQYSSDGRRALTLSRLPGAADTPSRSSQLRMDPD
eukprot:2773803-Rhodomonas_salina.1